MKFYLIATGICFFLIFIAHLFRAYLEVVRILIDPVVLFTTILSIGFCLWAVILLGKLKKI